MNTINDVSELLDIVTEERKLRIEAENNFDALLDNMEITEYLVQLQLEEHRMKFDTIKMVAENTEYNPTEAFNYIIDIINTQVNRA